jgi:hypothetical protein
MKIADGARIMSRPPLHDDTLAPALLSGSPYTRYLVACHEGVWFIKFDGEEYGPYQTWREAMLLAIDSAQKLGEQGEQTQVFGIVNGEALSVWTFGDPYPSRQ